MENINELSVYEAEKEIRNYLSPLFVSKPREPRLSSTKPTKEEMDDYNVKTAEYEVELQQYKIKNDFYKKENSRLYNLLEEKVREDSGLNNIPEQYRDKVYYNAYERGHDSGYGEVYNYLLDLVDIFN